MSHYKSQSCRHFASGDMTPRVNLSVKIQQSRGGAGGSPESLLLLLLLLRLASGNILCLPLKMQRGAIDMQPARHADQSRNNIIKHSIKPECIFNIGCQRCDEKRLGSAFVVLTARHFR